MDRTMATDPFAERAVLVFPFALQPASNVTRQLAPLTPTTSIPNAPAILSVRGERMFLCFQSPRLSRAGGIFFFDRGRPPPLDPPPPPPLAPPV